MPTPHSNKAVIKQLLLKQLPPTQLTYIGVDGCRAGWFYVGFDQDWNYQFGLLKQFAEIENFLANCQQILVDIPIGFREIHRQERLCDLAARKILGKRSSSIFPAPVRSVLKLEDYHQASAENYNCSGRKLSKQSWNIVAKIREVDEFLGKVKGTRKIRECHPEICFWALNNKTVVNTRKKTAEGIEERLEILSQYYQDVRKLVAEAQSSYRRKDLAIDDIIDALACGVAATFWNCLKVLPPEPELDTIGLPMEIVYPSLMN
ncbi:MAG: DUF429 domain-containing protein [Microcoleaceae cyanobacterium]